MPRYFFHVQDGSDFPDLQGTVLDDLPAARVEAVRFAGSLLSGTETFWQSSEWTLRVTDDQDLTLFDLRFFASDSAAGTRK